jgi:hypothetical protein
MTVGERMKMLITAEDYYAVRSETSDEFIAMAKTMLGDYQYIREKEENYQEMVKMLNGLEF